MPMDELDFMKEALSEATAAYDNGEYPIGAVIVHEQNVVGRGRNAEDSALDPTAHAEIVAIRDACTNLQTAKLSGCTLYTTIYPCPMCEASIVAAKIERVVYGGRTFPFFREVKWGKPTLDIVGPVLDQECRSLFERKLREKGRNDILNHGA